MTENVQRLSILILVRVAAWTRGPALQQVRDTSVNLYSRVVRQTASLVVRVLSGGGS